METSRDDSRLAICTKKSDGSFMVWGSVHADILYDIFFANANPIAWEGVPSDHKRVKGLYMTLNLDDTLLI